MTFLLDECISHDERFSAFLDLAENLTEQFWAQHYPGGDLTGVGSDYVELRASTADLVVLVKSLIVSR